VEAVKQPWLPDVKVEKIKRKRKSPQPKVARFRPIKKFELLHRPFDLRFRGRINKWLKNLLKKDIKIFTIIDRTNYRIIKAYFFPQEPKGKWLTQAQVVKKIGHISLYKIRNRLVKNLLIIWEKSKKSI
jgi:hypothetical protein